MKQTVFKKKIKHTIDDYIAFYGLLFLYCGLRALFSLHGREEDLQKVDFIWHPHSSTTYTRTTFCVPCGALKGPLS
jgi:hypothetical protein